MNRRWGAIAAATWVFAANPAYAQSAKVRFDIPAGDLAHALERAAQTAGVSLLFDRSRVATLQAPAVHARVTVEQALDSLLHGTGLTIKRLGPGTYVLIAPTVPTTPPPEAAIPDILVIGTRTQNTDIRRRADDVQPYRVVNARAVEGAQAASPEDLLRTRLAANELGASASQLGTPQGGSVRSQIDLRGLGTSQTLVLIDGRRMPSVPGMSDFLQPDINGVPLGAIERVETLGGTAGGIYGPGATGGVVNIVLKQDFPRAWLQAQSGVDATGDGVQTRVEGGFSLSSASGRTKFNVMAAHTVDHGLIFADRSFTQAAHYGRAANLNPGLGPALVLGASINILGGGEDYPPLTLIPALGGQSLGSRLAHYPVNAGGPNGNEAALLLAGAGTFDTVLSDDGNGARQSLLTPFEVTSLISSVHQEIGAHVELFANLLLFSERGRATVPGSSEIVQYLAPGDIGNPFDNYISVAVPTPGLASSAETRAKTSRFTVGAIVHFGHGWNLEIDAAAGQSSTRQRALPYDLQFDSVDVFSPGTQLADAIATIASMPLQTIYLSNRMHDISGRLAGPLMRLPGGDLTMTVSGEYRDERTLGARITNDDGSLAEPQAGAHRQQVSSVFGELRAPLVSTTSPLLPLRGLELQLAVRGDRYLIKEPNEDLQQNGKLETIEARHTTVAFTVGAKAKPIAGLTLRASFASGYLPPTPGQIVPTVSRRAQFFLDPRRHYPESLADLTQFNTVDDGRLTLDPELARTFAAGIIAEPHFLPGLRLSADYTVIRKTSEIVFFLRQDGHTYQYFVTHDLDFPGRITRAPATAADIARGDAGVITGVDASAMNVGRSTLKAVDFDLDYTRSTSLGRIHVFANATWVPSFLRRDDPFSDYREYAGKFDGPLKWKGNGGIEWNLGRLSAVINVQYIGSYDVTVATVTQLIDGHHDDRIAQQGAPSLPPQVYVDMGIGYRLPIRGHVIHAQFGVKNVLGKAPPLFVPLVDYRREQGDYSPGYSTYADPRGRRLVLTLGAEF